MRIEWIAGEIDVALLLHLCFVYGFKDAPYQSWHTQQYPFDYTDADHWLDVGAEFCKTE